MSIASKAALNLISQEMLEAKGAEWGYHVYRARDVKRERFVETLAFAYRSRSQ